MKKVKIYVAALLGAALAFASCSSGGDDAALMVLMAQAAAKSSAPVASNKTIYKVSSNLSDYMSRVEKRLGSQSWTGNASSAQAPDIFLIKGSDISNLTVDQVVIAVRTCLKGKTLVIDSPTPENLILFTSHCYKILNESENEALKADCITGPAYVNDFIASLEGLAANLNDLSDASTGLTYYTQKAYEAVAIRNREIHYEQKIDEKIPTYPMDENGSYGSVNASSDYEFPKDQYESLVLDSVEHLAKWIGGQSGSQSGNAAVGANVRGLLQMNAAEDAKRFAEAQASGEIQSWRNNFTAPLKKSDAKDKKLLEFLISENNKLASKAAAKLGDPSLLMPTTEQITSETVDYNVDVWAVSSIDAQTDYYLVRTSVTCNNQQLHNGKLMSKYGAEGPTTSIYDYDYFKSCRVEAYIDKSRQTIYSEHCAPANDIGSESFTNGTSYTVQGGANFGFTMTGPTGGISGTTSKTISSSTAVSIPNIDHKFSANGNESVVWTFTTKNHLAPIAVQMVTFDTVALFSLPSSCSCPDNSEYVELTLKIDAALAMRPLGTKKDILTSTTPITKTFRVKKPSNAHRLYNMTFKNKDKDLEPTQIAQLKGALESDCRMDEKTQLWYGATGYYVTLCGDEFSNANKKKAKFDSVAKAQFKLVKDKIADSKSIFVNAGFKGNYNFKIQTSDTDVVDQFDFDFGQ